MAAPNSNPKRVFSDKENNRIITMRQRRRSSWDEIAKALGTSRQVIVDHYATIAPTEAVDRRPRNK